MYERCVDSAFRYSPSPKSARADLSLLSHAIRELINSLPECIGGSEEIPRNTTEEERKAREQLLNAFKSAGQDSLKEEAGAGSVVIPAPLAAAFDSYCATATRGSMNSKKRDSFAVLGYWDPADPSIRPWSEARSFFMQFVHLPRGNPPKLPTKAEVVKKLSDIEDALQVRLGHFFDAKHRISEILEAANRINDGNGFLEPTEDAVLSAMASTGGDPILRHVFYAGLENPKWLGILEENGAFGDVPGFDERTLTFPYWPQGIYLRKIAPKQPDRVTEILLKAGKSENPSARRTVIETATAPGLPVECMTKLSKAIGNWAKDGYLANPYFWADADLFSLIEKLLTSKNRRANTSGTNLVRNCFMPLRTDGESLSFTGLLACIPESKYEDRLIQVSKHLRLGWRHRIYEDFLKQGLELLNNGKEGIRSTFWIPSIELACQSSEQTILNAVMRLLVSDLSDQARTDIDTFKKSFKDGTPPIMQRAAMYALTRTLTSSTTGDGHAGEATSKLAREILLSDKICDSEFASEYFPLLKTAIVCDAIPVLEVEQLIETSYSAVRDKYLSLSGEWDKGSAETRACEAARRWQHKALSLIGPEQLDDRGKSLLDRLTDEFGTGEYSTARSTSITRCTGPNSPLEAADMSKMTPDKLLDHLESWHPTEEDTFALISHEGQGRALSKLISKEPSFFKDKIERIEKLRPTYRRAVVEGWRQALKAGDAIPLNDFMRMALESSRIEDSAKFPADGDHPFDDDRDFRGLKRVVANALKELLRSDTKMSVEEGKEALEALVTLSGSSEPDVEYERRCYGDDTDPLLIAINTTRPLAIQGLGRWVRRFHEKMDVGQALEAISRTCPVASASLADAAAIGLIMPGLFASVPDWAKKHYETIFGRNGASEAQQVVLTTILAYYWPSNAILLHLRPAISNALGNNVKGYFLGFGRRAQHDCLWLIGKWLYLGYVNDFVEDDDALLAAWRNKAGEDCLGSVLGHICRLFVGSPSAPERVADRVAALWDYHKTCLVDKAGPKALRGIEMLVKSQRFSTDWWGPRMRFEFSVNPPDPNWPLAIENELKQLSDDNPSLALDILSCALETTKLPYYYDYEDVAVPILANARKIGGTEVNEKVKRCMDKLGQAGWASLDELVDRACSSPEDANPTDHEDA